MKSNLPPSAALSLALTQLLHLLVLTGGLWTGAPPSPICVYNMPRFAVVAMFPNYINLAYLKIYQCDCSGVSV